MSGPVAIWAALQNTALEPFRPASAYGAPALGGALVVCALYYARRRQARGRRISVRAFVRSIFPRRILLHPSSLVDMRLWALNSLVLASAYGMLAFGLFFWRDAVVTALAHGFGPHAPALWPAWTVLTLATVLQVLAYELAYWFAHYCFHKVPALWEFHKVHHSACTSLFLLVFLSTSPAPKYRWGRLTTRFQAAPTPLLQAVGRWPCGGRATPSRCPTWPRFRCRSRQLRQA